MLQLARRSTRSANIVLQASVNTRQIVYSSGIEQTRGHYEKTNRVRRYEITCRAILRCDVVHTMTRFRIIAKQLFYLNGSNVL